LLTLAVRRFRSAGPAINHFQQVPGIFWTSIVFGIAMAEGWRLTYGWTNPVGANKANDAGEVQGDLFSFKSGYYPGDIGFDPLGLKPQKKAEFDSMQTKELNNGRLAMIGVAGLVGQELATGTKAL
jgi:light-harvesting complex I chlorophyll a/b binding protein 1